MRHQISIALLWALFTAVAVTAAYYGFVVLSDTVAKMAVAVVAGAAGIMAAIVNNTLQHIRDQQMERLRKKRENYAQILEKLGAYLRDPDEKGDEFTTAHLLSWVVGSPEVVTLTLEFMANPHHQTLDKLLRQMRRDLEMPADKLDSVSTKGLFPTLRPKPSRGLG